MNEQFAVSQTSVSPGWLVSALLVPWSNCGASNFGESG